MRIYNIEQQIMLECTRHSINSQRLSHLMAHPHSLGQLITLSNQHGVFPLVYHCYMQQDISQQQYDQLSKVHKAISKQNLFITAQLLQVLSHFNNHSLECIPIKGPLLSYHLHKDPYMRQYSDIDILIHQEDYEQASKLLQSMDFTPLLSISVNAYPQISKFTNDCSFKHNQNNIVVELHWRLDKRQNIPLSQTSQLFYNADQRSYHGISYKALDLNTYLFYLCIHGSKHKWERLEWLCDIDRLIRLHQTDIHWEYLEKFAANNKMRTMFFVGLALSLHLYKTPIAHEPILNTLHQKSLQALMRKLLTLQTQKAPIPAPSKQISWYMISLDLALQDNLYQKVNTLFKLFFPFHLEDALKYDHFHTALLPFYRIFRKIKRLL